MSRLDFTKLNENAAQNPLRDVARPVDPATLLELYAEQHDHHALRRSNTKDFVRGN
jgi:hypothetical protein